MSCAPLHPCKGVAYVRVNYYYWSLLYAANFLFNNHRFVTKSCEAGIFLTVPMSYERSNKIAEWQSLYMLPRPRPLFSTTEEKSEDQTVVQNRGGTCFKSFGKSMSQLGLQFSNRGLPFTGCHTLAGIRIPRRACLNRNCWVPPPEFLV